MAANEDGESAARASPSATKPVVHESDRSTEADATSAGAPAREGLTTSVGLHQAAFVSARREARPAHSPSGTSSSATAKYCSAGKASDAVPPQGHAKADAPEAPVGSLTLVTHKEVSLYGCTRYLDRHDHGGSGGSQTVTKKPHQLWQRARRVYTAKINVILQDLSGQED